MGYKKRKVPTGYWPHRPGYNWLLGYPDLGRVDASEGVPEVFIDRGVKDGQKGS